VAEPPLDGRDGGLGEAPPVISLLVELPASLVHHQHLPPRLGALRPDLRDVPLDRDVRDASMLGDEVAYLTREIGLVSAEPPQILDEP